MRLGFVGTGTLAAAVVDALRLAAIHDDPIILSPRSDAVSQELVARHANVSRAASNQEVIDSSDVVFLGFRPQQLDEAMHGLQFRRHQVVVSFLAGVEQADLARRVTTDTAICRVMPLAPIRHLSGPILLNAEVDVVRRIFSGLGTIIVLEDEAQFKRLSLAGGLMSTCLQLQNAVIDWLVSGGVEKTAAALYVKAMFAGVSAAGLASPPDDRLDLPGLFETQGGLNARARNFLTAAGWFERMHDVLEALDKRTPLRPSRPKE